MPFPDLPPDPPAQGSAPSADGDVRALLAEMVEALEAVLMTAQVAPEEFDRGEADYAIREAVRRVNHLRRALNGRDEVA